MAEKKVKMTNRERVEALLRRETPDRVPSWPIALGFTTIYTGTTICDFYNKPQISYDAQKKTCEDFDFVFMPWTASATLLAWEFGGDIKWPQGEYSQAPTILEFPIKTPEEAYDLKMPDVLTSGFMPIFKEFCDISAKEQDDNTPFNVVAFPGSGPYTAAANIPGVDKFSQWMIKAPDACRHLMRLAIDFYTEIGRLWKETYGTEGVLPLFGEPSCSNQVISPKQFEAFAMPCMKEVADNLLEMGYTHLWAHVCGEHNKNLEHWAKINWGDPGIISTPHEVELEKMDEFFPNDIIFGNIEPAIIQTKTAEEVYEATRDMVERGKKLNAGYIFSQGCELPPMAPVENIKAMQQAVEDFGYY